MEERKTLFYVTEVTNLGDLGHYLKDASYDDMACMFHIKGVRIGSGENIYEDVAGFQALGTDAESQIGNPGFVLNLGKPHNLLYSRDVICDFGKTVSPIMLAVEYSDMKKEGIAPNEINQQLMNKYNKTTPVKATAVQKVK